MVSNIQINSSGNPQLVKHIAIFASGTGSNAERIMTYFDGHPSIRVELVVSNKAKAPVLEKARAHGVATHLIARTSFYDTQDILDVLSKYKIDLIVLAGFMWLIPPYLVAAYAGRMLNIHPALLPAYGGKGMYGQHVHRAVHAAGERETGITIHQVNERYDEGSIVFQASCELSPDDTPEAIARKVQLLEHQYFAPVIEEFIQEHFD